MDYKEGEDLVVIGKKFKQIPQMTSTPIICGKDESIHNSSSGECDESSKSSSYVITCVNTSESYTLVKTNEYLEEFDSESNSSLKDEECEKILFGGLSDADRDISGDVTDEELEEELLSIDSDFRLKCSDDTSIFDNEVSSTTKDEVFNEENIQTQDNEFNVNFHLSELNNGNEDSEKIPQQLEEHFINNSDVGINAALRDETHEKANRENSYDEIETTSRINTLSEEFQVLNASRKAFIHIEDIDMIPITEKKTITKEDYNFVKDNHKYHHLANVNKTPEISSDILYKSGNKEENQSSVKCDLYENEGTMNHDKMILFDQCYSKKTEILTTSPTSTSSKLEENISFHHVCMSPRPPSEESDTCEISDGNTEKEIKTNKNCANDSTTIHNSSSIKSLRYQAARRHFEHIKDKTDAVSHFYKRIKKEMSYFDNFKHLKSPTSYDNTDDSTKISENSTFLEAAKSSKSTSFLSWKLNRSQKERDDFKYERNEKEMASANFPEGGVFMANVIEGETDIEKFEMSDRNNTEVLKNGIKFFKNEPHESLNTSMLNQSDADFKNDIENDPMDILSCSEVKSSGAGTIFSNSVPTQTQVMNLTTNDTNFACCTYCKRTLSKANFCQINKETTVNMDTECEEIADTKSSGFDIFIQLFNIDNTLCKHILLAVASNNFINGVTYTEIIKYIRKKKLFKTKMLQDVRTFLQTAVKIKILEMKGKRYYLKKSLW